MRVTDATVLDRVERWVSLHPAKHAFVFLDSDGNHTDSLTYGELDRRARCVATSIQASVPWGSRVLLACGQGPDFICSFMGCLLAGVVAVPLYAPHPRRTDERFLSIAGDCSPALIVTDARSAERCITALARVGVLRCVPVLVVDGTAGDACAELPAAHPDGIAFLQYTSGSTRSPRGVVVRHRNLFANETMIQRAMAFGADEVFVSWLPTHHDMGLIGDTLQPLFCGGTGVKMPPAAFLRKPQRWLEAVTKYEGTTIGAPNFAYQMCCDQIPADVRARLDLSSLHVAYCGAEPVRPATLRKFADMFAPVGFCRDAFAPCYGLAEATLMVSGGPRSQGLSAVRLDRPALARHVVADARSEAHSITLAGCGAAVPDCTIVIVDPSTGDECDPGRVGEILVAGPHVSDGYWGRCDDGDTMRAYLRDGRGPFLRTGDLGFMSDGQLVVAGRLKDLLIIRGRNVYPQDIEHCSGSAHPCLTGHTAVAFAVGETDQNVVLIQECDRTTPPDVAKSARAAIISIVAATHQLTAADVIIVAAGAIPRTTSGKVRRSFAREIYMRGEYECLSSVRQETWHAHE